MIPESDVQPQVEPITIAEPANIHYAVALVIVALCVPYAILTRTPADFLRYPTLIALAVMAFSVSVFGRLNQAVSTVAGNKAGLKVLSALALMFISIAAGICSYCIWVATKDAFLWTTINASSKPFAALISALLVLASGGMLFYFRLRRRCLYGLTEAAIGVSVGVYRVSTEATRAYLTEPGFYLAVLTASIYLVVRGLDNIHQGLTKDPRDTTSLRLVEGFSEWAKTSLMQSKSRRLRAVALGFRLARAQRLKRQSQDRANQDPPS